MTDYTVRQTCRLCDGPLTEVLRLADTPPANALLNERQAEYSGLVARMHPLDQAVHPAETRYPLILSSCLDCAHVQMPVVVDPALMFQDYAYVSGTSPVFREHLAKLGRHLATRLFPGDLVVEIGSNDGTLLKQFPPPFRTLGIDPARNVAARATKEGVLTAPYFFDMATARATVRSVGRARLVLALNVLAHADDLAGIADATRELLADDGELVLEVAYLPDMLRDCSWDLIYAEHLAYWHLAPLVKFYAAHGLHLYDAERVDSQGGSIRCYVSKRPKRATDQLERLLGEERQLVTPETIADFVRRVEENRGELRELLLGLKAKGHRIAGFGCPAKATTLLHYIDVGADTLDYLVEENPLKVGKFSPGKHVPVVGVEKLRDDPPDYLVVFAWNFASNIMARFDWFPGKWILPLPKVRVLDE